MKRWTVYVTILAVFAILALPAMAGRTVVTGSIALESASRLADDGSWPRYGDSVGFSSTVNGTLKKNSRVYVQVVCTQDGHIVYQASEAVGTSFTLSDQSGQGLEWDGGPAECGGYLVYFEDRREDLILYLDEAPFDVAA